MFQCTLCFGVLFNVKAAYESQINACFNALCALGFSSTMESNRTLKGGRVSMHSVLWGSLQLILELHGGTRVSFNALCALGFSSTKMKKIYAAIVLFQCTLCFGVLFNVSGDGRWSPAICFNALCALGFSSTARFTSLKVTSLVSMHSVLWGSLQPSVSILSSVPVLVSMHSVLWGSLQLNGYSKTGHGASVSMHSVLWGSLQLSATLAPGQEDRFQCTLCFGVLFNF